MTQRLDADSGISHRADLVVLRAGSPASDLRPDFAGEILAADAETAAVGLEYLVTDGLPGIGLEIEPVLPLTLWEIDALGAAGLRSPADMPRAALSALGAGCAHTSRDAWSDLCPTILRHAARAARDDWGNGRILAIYAREVSFAMSADLGGNMESLDGEAAEDEDGMAAITARLFGTGYVIDRESAHRRIAGRAGLLGALAIHDAILREQTGIEVTSRLGTMGKTDR